MKLLKTVSLSFITLSFLLASCKKEDNESKNCGILKTELYEANTVAFRGYYTYTNNQITKVEVPEIGGYYLLDYTGDKITKRNFFVNGSSVIDMYDQISYNADGTINKIETFELVGPGNTYERYNLTTFIYTNGKLSKLQIFEDWGNATELIEEYTYTYTGNNITSFVYKDLETFQTKNFTFQYNTENNFYHALNSHILLADPVLSSVDGMFPVIAGELLPLVLSANNATSIQEDNTAAMPIEYTKDENGNITALRIDGEQRIGYAYRCN